MADYRPFCAWRPTKEHAAEVAALPYDVMSSLEAREMVKGHPLSFLHVDRAEVDFPVETDIYSDEVYEKAAANLRGLKESGVLVRDAEASYYLYREVMGEHSQVGIVGCASVDEYLSGKIKKHELTVSAKEKDRIRHVDACDANTGVIFLAFRDDEEIMARMDAILSRSEPDTDFTSEDGVRHTVWRVSDPKDVAFFRGAFKKIPALYIADGHHRTASAVRVGEMRRRGKADLTGEEEFSYFLSAAFPASSLKILDYNRVVSDLHGMTDEAFLEKLGESFAVERLPEASGDAEEDLSFAKPKEPHTMSLYLGGAWYRLTAHGDAYDPDDPVSRLDVQILQEKVLTALLDIKDPRTDSRIAFVGGIRGLSELKRRVDGGAKAAFAMYPTSMEDLMAIADAGRIMPPKSTWFEPKLRSGLFIHDLT